MSGNLAKLFSNFGQEAVTRASHLEKLCLIEEGVGRDNISGFATNLIKKFLLSYTQDFAQRHLTPGQRRRINVTKTTFNFDTESWENGTFDLPYVADDYVILTPRVTQPPVGQIARWSLDLPGLDHHASALDWRTRSAVNHRPHVGVPNSRVHGSGTERGFRALAVRRRPHAELTRFGGPSGPQVGPSTPSQLN